MNKQLWFLPILIFSLLLPPRMATAQHLKPTRSPILSMYAKYSHYDLPGELAPANAEELMAQRLHELRELHQLQDQLQGLLNNPEFRNYIKDLKETDLRRLQEKIFQGEDLSRDRNWKRLLEKASTWPKLDERQIEMLHRYTETAEHQRTPPAVPPMLSGPGPVTTPPITSMPAPPTPPSSFPEEAKPEPSFVERMKKDSAKWLMDNLDDAGGNVLEALTKMDGGAEGSPLAEFLRTMRKPDFADLALSENSFFPTLRVEKLANSLSNMGEFLHPQGGVWDEMRSLFRDASVPALPRLDASVANASGSSAVDGDGGAPALLSLMMLGVFVVLLCKLGLGTKLPTAGDVQWRLGPWPMPPSRVSTRQDLIRVFEHLVLLCLGPTAAVCHHRALAARLVERDRGNPGLRLAAEMLAWLYEQARYAPAEDTLSPEQMSDARQALCLLAGVTAQ